MAEIILRKYTENDKAAVDNMVKGKHEEEYLDDDRFKHITVAKYDNTVAGFLYISIYYGQAQIFVYVLPEYRRRGIGTVLYNKAEKEARETGCRDIWSTYYNKEDGDGFVNKIGAAQIKGNDFMKYDGGLLPEKDFFIRAYKSEDFERYAYINSRAWHDLRIKTGDTESKIIEPTEEERQKSKDNDNCYILEDGGQIAGFGNIDCDNAGNYHINAVCVDVELYNRGYGRALTVFLTNEILRRGKNAAYLTVEQGNINAKHIYETVGYKKLYTGYSPIKKL